MGDHSGHSLTNTWLKIEIEMEHFMGNVPADNTNPPLLDACSIRILLYFTIVYHIKIICSGVHHDYYSLSLCEGYSPVF